MQWIYNQAERGRIPDPLIRFGIRRLLRRRLRRASRGDIAALIDHMRSAPLALYTADANRQHYELPAEFFRRVLGPRLKYSCCYWPSGGESLGAAEDASLELTCERAQLADGMEILELGCGWGSLSLWMAEHYPNSRILAVSNSAAQRQFITAEMERRGLSNLEVKTVDMNDFEPNVGDSASRRFDRVVSVEMFEHMRNYRRLLSRIASWLTTDGRLFVHVFCHRRYPYLFDHNDSSDWMARHFFTGGLMPSEDIFRHFEEDLVTEQQWRVGGEHYAHTLRAWLTQFDDDRDACQELFRETYGAEKAEPWRHRWRLFFLACAELFAFRGGQEWYVTHTLLRPVR